VSKSKRNLKTTRKEAERSGGGGSNQSNWVVPKGEEGPSNRKKERFSSNYPGGRNGDKRKAQGSSKTSKNPRGDIWRGSRGKNL